MQRPLSKLSPIYKSDTGIKWLVSLLSWCMWKMEIWSLPINLPLTLTGLLLTKLQYSKVLRTDIHDLLSILQWSKSQKEHNNINSESIDKDMFQGQVMMDDWLNAPVEEGKRWYEGCKESSDTLCCVKVHLHDFFVLLQTGMEMDLIRIICHKFTHNNPQYGTKVKSIQSLWLLFSISRSLTFHCPQGRFVIVPHSLQF